MGYPVRYYTLHCLCNTLTTVCRTLKKTLPDVLGFADEEKWPNGIVNEAVKATGLLQKSDLMSELEKQVEESFADALDPQTGWYAGNDNKNSHKFELIATLVK